MSRKSAPAVPAAPMVMMTCAALLAALLAGCAGDTGDVGADSVGVTEGFFGAVAVDEPRAAVTARDVLVEGGSAADAAVSAFFTLAVTLPSSAGLGAGGECVVFDPAGKRFERLDFLPRPAGAGAGAGAGKDGIALPVGPRAMFALHARYGRLPFSMLLGNAEQLARFGDIVSRRLAVDIARDGADLRNIPGRVISGRLEAGDALVQLDLAATLGRLRSAGIGDLYSGQLARRFAVNAEALGHNVDAARLRRAVPVWSGVDAGAGRGAGGGLLYDNHLWAMAASGGDDRALLRKILALALQEGKWGREGTDPQDILMGAEISVRAANAVADGNTDTGREEAKRLFGDFSAAAPRTAVTPGAAALLGGRSRAGATGFAITDRSGLSVGCALTLNAPFGTGEELRDLGIFAAKAHPGADAPLAAAVVAGNRNTWQMHMTAAATGGRAVVSALAPVIARNYRGGQGLAAAIAAPRGHFDPQAGTLVVEEGAAPEAVSAASAAGYPVAVEERPLAAVRLFRCRGGYPGTEDCGAADDPRSLGLVLFEAIR